MLKIKKLPFPTFEEFEKSKQNKEIKIDGINDKVFTRLPKGAFEYEFGCIDCDILTVKIIDYTIGKYFIVESKFVDDIPLEYEPQQKEQYYNSLIEVLQEKFEEYVTKHFLEA